MLRFVARRLLVAVPTLLVVITLAFFLMRAAPGNPFVSSRKLPPAIERNMKAKYGLDRPLPAQYVAYLAGVVRGDFGPSMKYQDKSVAQIVADGFPTSLAIGSSALAIAAVAGVGLGAAAAIRRNSWVDYLVTGVSILGVCVPTFVTAPLLVLLFGLRLGWLPTGGLTGPESLVLPVAVLALPQIAIISRLTRAGLIETLKSNYIRTARARGLSESQILLRHALRGGLLPLVSYLGPACAGLITGSLVIERIFNLPGLGRNFVVSALQRDYTVVMGVVILYAGLIVALNLAADLAYALLDPRVRLS